MLSKTTNNDRKDDTPLFRKSPLQKFPSLEMTHIELCKMSLTEFKLF